MLDFDLPSMNIGVPVDRAIVINQRVVQVDALKLVHGEIRLKRREKLLYILITIGGITTGKAVLCVDGNKDSIFIGG